MAADNPLAMVVAIWLWAACSARLAAQWFGLLCLGGLILVGQKMLYYVGGVSLTSISLYTMSGHAVAATYIYGSLVAILVRGWPRGVRWGAFLATAALVLAIGVSRVAVAHHRPSEAISGLILGAILLGCFLRFVWRRATPRLSVLWLAAPSLIVIFVTYGRVYEFENIFRWLGRRANPGVRFYR